VTIWGRFKRCCQISGTRRKLLKQLEIFNASPLETLDPQMIRYRSQKTFYEFVSCRQQLILKQVLKNVEKENDN